MCAIFFRTGGVALVAVFAWAGTVSAETRYVDQRYGPGGDGSRARPYATIQQALDDQTATEVCVYPGTYSERLTVAKSLRLYGYDGPLTTRVEAASGGDTLTVGEGFVVSVEGLTLSSGRYGVFFDSHGSLYLRNCVVCGNTSHGLYVGRKSCSNTPRVWILNCVVARNGGSGLYLNMTGHCEPGYAEVTALNNIFIGNDGFGVGDAGWAFDTHRITLDYNDSVDNTAGSYSPLFGPGRRVPVGAHALAVAPEFVGWAEVTCNMDFRLVPTSPLREAGHPGIGFLDPDGTRNDLGAYGGPGARTFYTMPNDGPFVRDVSIDQGIIPKGETFTLRATGAVR